MSSYMPLPIGASQAAGVAPAPSMATPIVGAQEDYVYNSLLKERIIWLGSEVRDSNANLICSQMLLLSAEEPSTCTSTRPAAPSPPAWRATTPGSSSRTTW